MLVRYWDLVYQSVEKLAERFAESIPFIVIAIIFLIITNIVSHIVSFIIRKSLKRTPMRRALVELLQKLASVLVWAIGILTIAAILFPSVTPGNILTALGLTSIAIGFAFKDIFENFFAGILILLREPFRLGDFIECQSIDGRIELITIRDTHIRRSSGDRIVMPNAFLFNNPVHIITDRELRRVQTTCGVSYNCDVDKAREIITNTVNDCETVTSDQDIDVFVKELGDNSVNFQITWWTYSRPRETRRSKDEVLSKLKMALDQANIEIPFPQRTLTFAQSLSIKEKS